MKHLAIVIINYKTPDLITSAIASLIDDIQTENAKIIIVDNNSRDNSTEYIRSWIRDNQLGGLIHFINSPHNGGFAAGNNIGIRAVAAENYLLLNSDTLVRPKAIQHLLECSKLYPQAGFISPRLEWPDGEPQQSCFRFHHPLSELVLAAKTGFITSLLASYVVAQPVKTQPDFYDWTSFACVLLKREVIEQVGFLDEQYFMYFEDVDLCLQAQKAGWKVLNVPEAHVVHLRGGSSPLKSHLRQRKRLPRYFYESRTRYYFKWYGRGGLLAANLLWTTGFLISSFRALISKKYQSAAAAGQWRDIWINFRQPSKPYIHPDDYGKT